MVLIILFIRKHGPWYIAPLLWKCCTWSAVTPAAINLSAKEQNSLIHSSTISNLSSHYYVQHLLKHRACIISVETDTSDSKNVLYVAYMGIIFLHELITYKNILGVWYIFTMFMFRIKPISSMTINICIMSLSCRVGQEFVLNFGLYWGTLHKIVILQTVFMTDSP